MRTFASLIVALVVVCAKTSYGLQDFIGEGNFVVDDRAVQMYVREIPGSETYAVKRARAVINMQKDLEYLLAEANTLIKTLSSFGVSLEIRKKSLTILNTDVFPSNVLQGGNLINGGAGLSEFSKWLVSQNATTPQQYDFAMLLTGYDLFGDIGTYTLGIANVGRICNSVTGVGVVEYNGTYATAEVLAHEIIHIFGGSHDGIASDKLMATTTTANQKHRWELSECSATDIKEYLPLLSPNCLLDTNPSSARLTPSWSTYSGQLFNADVVCQRSLNDPRSYACLSTSLYNNAPPKGDSICQIIYCSIPDTSLCRQAYPSDGMICDTSKRCNKGKCQPDSSPASTAVSSNCVLGNQKSIQLVGDSPFYGSCPDLIAQRGQSLCYNEGVMQLCCSTCNQGKTGISGCEHGDKNSLCSKIPKSTACAVQNLAVCCSTCNGYMGKRSTHEDVTVLLENTPPQVDQEYVAKVNNDTVRSF